MRATLPFMLITRRLFSRWLPAGGAAVNQVPGGGKREFDVRAQGAAGDGRRLDTANIQAAVDACSRQGGGTVVFPPGTYLSGTIVLKSGVTLHLDPGAVLLGSTSLADYPVHIPKLRSYTDTYTERSLIFAEGVANVAITGRGVIDGQGAAFEGPYKRRPYLVRFVECRDVAVTGVTLRNSPMWVQHYLACEQVLIHGVTVRSRVNHNNDGIDIDASRNVRISDCDISSGDDAIVLKSTTDRRTANVVVTNCLLSTACNALKMGTETNAGFENIVISNCAIRDTGLAGLTLQIVDGGTLDGVAVSNLTMRGVGAPVFIRLGDRARPFVAGGPRPGIGRLRNVTIANIEATGAGATGCAIAGLPGHPIENLTLDNIRLEFEGGVAEKPATPVPEHPEKYPEHSMFGRLPAYGLYCRHVANLRLRNLEARVVKPDVRPAVLLEDVQPPNP
jgi:polygalacturonase